MSTLNLKMIGLKNRGNTCYLNTAIQCLYNLTNLTEYFISNNYLVDLKNRFTEVKSSNSSFDEVLLSKEYAKLINALYNSTDGAIEPKSLHEIIQKYNQAFVGYEQQDSQEALSLILDKLHEGLKYDIEISYSGKIENDLDQIMVESIENWKMNLNNKYSIVADLFFGQFINKIMSLDNVANETVSKTFEMFNMLNIPIYGKTIYDSLSKYFEKEILETKFFDEKNNKYISAYKQIKLMKIPKYLIIVLKRYINHSSGNIFKSNNIISFPLDDLNLSPYSEGYESINSNLNLISIGCHYGGLNGGHYYSICRTKENKWYKCDDDIIEEINMEKNMTDIFKFGYILIYEKNE